MKKTVSLILCLVLTVFGFNACSSDNKTIAESNKTSTTSPATVASAGKHNVQIVIKNYGTIELELNGDKAPITVNNFIKLAKSGFYDGLTFHRIIKGFVIQGGDPDATGRGGSEETIKGEFLSNGSSNDLKHTRGAISMARSSSPDSASSQFFICQQAQQSLDGNYAVFGYVTSGIEIVDKICDTVASSNLVPAQDQPVIETIKVID